MAYSLRREFESYSRRRFQSNKHKHHRRHGQEHDYYPPGDERHAYPNGPYYTESPASTYGTYIYQLDARGYSVSSDSTRCGCDYYPHPINMTSAGDQRPHYHTPEPRNAPRGTYQGRRESPPAGSPGHGHAKRRAADCIVLHVEDNSSLGSQSGHERSYPIYIQANASLDDVVSFLAPDRRRSKVFVHWADGEVEPLDELVPIEDLERYAERLEVRDRKQVRWSGVAQ